MREIVRKSVDRSWGKKVVDESFEARWKVARVNTVGLCGAFALTFVNPIAGMATGFAVSGIAGVAEGVAKRNISSFGHLEDHFAQKMHAAVNLMAKDSHLFLAIEAQRDLNKLLESNPESKTKKSAGARLLSYFSGPVVSGVNSLVSRFVDFSPALSGAVGAFIPVLPLITVALSRKAANLRHESAVAKKEHFDKVVKILFDENSWQDKEFGAKKIDDLSSQFAQNLAKSDNHGRLPKDHTGADDHKFHKAKAGEKDNNKNIKKGVTLLPWLGAKINKFIKRKILKTEVRDIAEYPSGGVEYVAFAKESGEKERRDDGQGLSISKEPAKEDAVVAPEIAAAPRVVLEADVGSSATNQAQGRFDEHEDQFYRVPNSRLDGIKKTPMEKLRIRGPEATIQSEAEMALKAFTASVSPFQSRVTQARDGARKDQNWVLQDVEGDEKASSSFTASGPAENLSGNYKAATAKK